MAKIGKGIHHDEDVSRIFIDPMMTNLDYPPITGRFRPSTRLVSTPLTQAIRVGHGTLPVSRPADSGGVAGPDRWPYPPGE